ncbi:MAG: hypothetical protein WCF57_01780 [Pyrinomonadaceae bacterium]
MFKLTAALLICLAVAAYATAQSSTSKFRYRPEKIVVGTVYHYLKTNIDGTEPEHVSQYVASRERLEAFKFHPKGERAALVTADMDWSIFSAKRLESWQVYASGERKLFATLAYLGAEKAVEVSIPSMRKANEKSAIKYLPFHVYNFDLGSLNFAFRHLTNPRGSFMVGLADPTFKDEGALFGYRGEVTVDYAGEEMRQGARCRKYRIDGAGLENRGGNIWVNKSKGHIEDMEILLPDNPNWQSFKFRLTGTQQMSRAEWEAFMKKQF